MRVKSKLELVRQTVANKGFHFHYRATRAVLEMLKSWIQVVAIRPVTQRNTGSSHLKMNLLLLLFEEQTCISWFFGHLVSAATSSSVRRDKWMTSKRKGLLQQMINDNESSQKVFGAFVIEGSLPWAATARRVPPLNGVQTLVVVRDYSETAMLLNQGSGESEKTGWLWGGEGIAAWVN